MDAFQPPLAHEIVEIAPDRHLVDSEIRRQLPHADGPSQEGAAEDRLPALDGGEASFGDHAWIMGRIEHPRAILC